MKKHRVKQGREPQVKVFIQMYEPLEVTECKKCGKIILETVVFYEFLSLMDKRLSFNSIEECY